MAEKGIAKVVVVGIVVGEVIMVAASRGRRRLLARCFMEKEELV